MIKNRKIKFHRDMNIMNCTKGYYIKELKDGDFIRIIEKLCNDMNIKLIKFSSYFDDCKIKIKCNHKDYIKFLVLFAEATNGYVNNIN